MLLSASEASGPGLRLAQQSQLQLPKEVDFMDDKKVCELPQSSICSSQVVLSLKGKFELTALSPIYFRRMTHLQVLDLSHTSIKSLPKSLFKLVSLKSLLLRGCQLFMELSPQIGKLTNLEELDLDETEIMDLPIEIRELSKLRKLRVSFYQTCGKQKLKWNVLIHPETVSILSQLTELSVNMNPADERWDDMVELVVKEVCKSMTLRTLSLYLPKFQLLDYLSSIYPSLTRFRFIVGHHKRRIISRVPHEVEAEFINWEKCLKFVNGDTIPIEIQGVLEYSTSFFLDNHVTGTSLFEFGIENMKRLKFCLLAECDNMETIIDGERHHKGYEDDGSESDLGSAKTALESLEYMHIYCMDNLTSIWRGPNGFGYMPKLKILALHTCPRLINIFSHSMLENFVNLEELILEDCPQVTSLVSHASVIPMMSDKFLPSLKRLLLLYLPQLVTISNGLPIAPKLESIGFYNCPKLKSISKMELSSKSLNIIKGESQWWKDLNWDESEWGNWPDYLTQIFSPINHEQDVMTQMAEDKDLFEATIHNERKMLDYLEERITGTDVTKPSNSECIFPSIPGLEIAERACSFTPKWELEIFGTDIASEISELDDDEDESVAKKWNCTEYVSKTRGGDITLLRTRNKYEALDDGYKWRKYGMKNTRFSQRKYYNCSTKGCPVKKMVQFDPRESNFWIVKYKGAHNHDMPCYVYFNKLSPRCHHHGDRNVEDTAETTQNMISFTKGSIEDNQQPDGKTDQMMRTNMKNTIPSPLPTPIFSSYSSIHSARTPEYSHPLLTNTLNILLSPSQITTGNFEAQSLNKKGHSGKDKTKTSVTSLEKHPKQDESMGKLQAADSKQNPDPPMRRKSDEAYSWRCYGSNVWGGNIIKSYYKCAFQCCPAEKIVECSSDGHITNIVLHAKHNHLESQSDPARTSPLSAFSQNIRASNCLTIKIPDNFFVTYEGGQMDPKVASFVSMKSAYSYLFHPCDESSKGKRNRRRAQTTLLKCTDSSNFREMVQTMTGKGRGNTGTGSGRKKNDPECCPNS